MRAAGLLVAASAAVGGCGSGPAEPLAPAGRVLLAAPRASALALQQDGTLLAGTVDTGRVRQSPSAVGALPRLRIATGGQRGLLGLAAGPGGRIYASYTRAGDRRIVVEQIAPPPIRRVWTGPRSSDLANGGHIELAPDGRLVIGIGDLQDPSRLDDPRAPNGKLLALRVDGRNRRPAVLSSGWNNPFAFTFTPGGRLWVADNAPGDRPERLARGDRAGAAQQISAIEGRVAPAGLAAISDTELAVCGFVSRRLDRYRLRDGRWRRAGTIARGCRYGVVLLGDGRLAFSTGREIRTVPAR